MNFITNPKTGRKVSIYGKTGKKVLQNYAKQLSSGGAKSKKLLLTEKNIVKILKKFDSCYKKKCKSEINSFNKQAQINNKKCSKHKNDVKKMICMIKSNEKDKKLISLYKKKLKCSINKCKKLSKQIEEIVKKEFSKKKKK